MTKKINCCFCNKEIDYTNSNNPEPLMKYPNRCCSECNFSRVITARIMEIEKYRSAFVS